MVPQENISRLRSLGFRLLLFYFSGREQSRRKKMGWKSHKLCYETSKWNILRLTSTKLELYIQHKHKKNIWRNMFILFHFIFLRAASLAINYFSLFFLLFIIVIILIYVSLCELVHFLMLHASLWSAVRRTKKKQCVVQDDKRRARGTVSKILNSDASPRWVPVDGEKCEKC
jgi:hypothetical protein